MYALLHFYAVCYNFDYRSADKDYVETDLVARNNNTYHVTILATRLKTSGCVDEENFDKSQLEKVISRRCQQKCFL